MNIRMQCLYGVVYLIEKKPQKKCLGYDTELHLMVRFLFWRSGGG